MSVPLKFSTAIDNAGFNAGLRDIEQSAEKAGKKIGNSLNKGFNPGMRTTGDIINAITGGRGAVMELRALEGLTGASLAVAAGAVLAFKAFESYRESIKAVKDANDEASKSFTNLNSSILAGGPESVSNKIKSDDELISKLKDTRGFWAKVSARKNFGWSGIGNDALQNSKDEEGKLKDRNKQLTKEAIRGIHEETRARKEALNQTERQTLLAENAKKFEKEKAEIQMKMAPGIAGAAIKLAEVEAANQRKLINHEMDGKQRALRLENKISDIRKEGTDVEDRSLSAKIRAADKTTFKSLNPDERQNASKEAEKLRGDQKEFRIKRAAEQDKLVETESLRLSAEAEEKRKRLTELGVELGTAKKRQDLENAKKVFTQLDIAGDAVQDRHDQLTKQILGHNPHAAIQARMAHNAAARAEAKADRMMGITAKDRERINDAKNIAKGLIQKAETELSGASIEKLAAAIKELQAQ